MTSQSSFLLPHKFQVAGWWGLLISAVLFILLLLADIYSPNTATPPVGLSEIPFLASLLLICISREKIDDEYISTLRGRTVCAIVIAFVTIKFLYYIVWTMGLYSVGLPNMGYVGYISFVNLLTNPIVLIVIYIVAFRIVLIVNNHKMKSYAE